MIDNEIELKEDDWAFSAPMDLQNIEETVFVLRPVSNKPFKNILKMELFKEYERTFVVFKEATNIEEDQIIIHNELKYTKIKVYQEVVDEKEPSWIDSKFFEVNSN